jgi:hypothetical protein
VSSVHDGTTKPIVETGGGVAGGHRPEVSASRNVNTLRVNYSAAKTDEAIISAAAGEQISVLAILVTSDADTTPNVDVLIGFGAATTPTGEGVVMSHPGIAPGGYVERGNGFGVLGIGGPGEDLRITSDAPTSGSIDVVVTYSISD